MPTLYDLLPACTVKILTPGQGWGTGFFVAPGQLLTCAHVVQAQGTEAIALVRQGQPWGTAQVVTLLPAPLDLALLHLETAASDDYPCVQLVAGAEPPQPLYLYGYSDTLPEGESVQGDCEGIAIQQGVEFIKFKLGRVRPGISGAPVLNVQTGGVCGLVRQTLDRSDLVGGLALPTAQILTCFPQLAAANQAFHHRDRRWQQARSQTRWPQGYPAAPVAGGSRPHGEGMLLQRVQRDHVDLPLQSALFNLDPITLTKVDTPQQVRPLGQKYVLVGDAAAVSSAAPIEQDWDACGGKLLILGQPGAGKTTTLLVLAQALVDRALGDATAGIPVIVNLASWQPGQAIATWLLGQLKDNYGLRPQQGRLYLQQRKLIPLLDGLDEQLHLADCVTAINQFLADPVHGPNQLAVCCRQAAYDLLGQAAPAAPQDSPGLLLSPDQIAAAQPPTHREHRLQLNGAIALQPLSRDQITAYLHRFPADYGLAALTERQAIMDLIQTPLLLSVTAIACRHLSLDHLAQLATPAAQAQYLWQGYLHQMLTYGETQNQRGDRRHPFPPPPQTVHWLGEIAHQLTRSAQTEFLIEALQPSWYPPRLRHRIDRGLAGLRALAHLCGAIALPGLFYWFIRAYWAVFVSLDPDLAFQLPAWVIYSFVPAAAAPLAQGLRVGLRQLLYADIRLVESLRWSWPGFAQGLHQVPRQTCRGLALLCWWPLKGIKPLFQAIPLPQISGIGILFLLAIPVVILSLVGFVLSVLLSHLWAGRWLPLGMIGLLAGGLWVCLALPQGIQVVDLETRIFPNQGIYRSQRSFLVGFSVHVVRVVGGVLLLTALLLTLTDGHPIPSAGSGADWSLAQGLSVLFLMVFGLGLLPWMGFSLAWGFWRYGGSTCLRYGLVRVLLSLWRVLPWNCARFLNQATELRLMQRVGGRYRFIHRSFQDYLAGEEITPSFPTPE